jgi:CRISPR-associated protein Cas6/Cse3/CasE subtype I-E
VKVQKTLRSTIYISKQTGNFSLVGTAFEGVLKITDPALFKAAFRKGIGQGKAYGFGMLMLMRKVAA